MLTLLRDLRRLRREIALPAPARGGSLALRHVDAGSCNGCEHELTLTSSPYYDLQRYGLGIVASPRHADVLLVTGAVTTRMHEPLLVAHAAMPEPRRVVALGDCALGCNLLGTRRGDRRPGRGDPPRRPAHPRLPAPAADDRRSAADAPRSAVGRAPQFTPQNDTGPPMGGPVGRDALRCYAVGTGVAPAVFGDFLPKILRAGSGLRSVPPTASTANPIPESRSAIPTTMPKSASCSAM